MIITIGSSPGAGKQRIGRLLAEQLGFRFCTIDDLRRKLAAERDITEEEFAAGGENEFFTDAEIDGYVEEIGHTYENLVIASRFGFHLVPHSLRVFVKADAMVTAKSHVDGQEDRYGDTIRDILEQLHGRMHEDRERGLKFYGKDPHDPSHYDVVLDANRLDEGALVSALKHTVEQIKDRWSPEHI